MSRRTVIVSLLVGYLALLSLATQLHAVTHLVHDHHGNACEWCQQYDNLNTALAHAELELEPSFVHFAPHNLPTVHHGIAPQRRTLIRAPPFS